MTRHPVRAAIAGVATLLLTACAASQPAPAGSAPTTGTAAEPAVPTGTLPADPDGVLPATSVAADPAAVTTALRFVRAWARPDLPAETWWAGVRPYAVPAYAELLATVDPANVPATRLTGGGQVVAATAQRVDVDVSTDAGVLRVVCVRSGHRWLVATLGVAKEAAAR
ncbi:hypothetical protein DER29_5943 [Micromonospora sp. M71_S20]|uniref:hypothetical protein n=1 Tax=Micromonospora sp. M71_S20 TaxID=592872 RepID=UPI000F21B63F|nr:hypothetical protein [Micromonospora sp. M71_S20]RLK12660.1 hypothetical protein DER29_5943 [Micromonospora sp. M71_S20]